MDISTSIGTFRKGEGSWIFPLRGGGELVLSRRGISWILDLRDAPHLIDLGLIESHSPLADTTSTWRRVGVSPEAVVVAFKSWLITVSQVEAWGKGCLSPQEPPKGKEGEPWWTRLRPSDGAWGAMGGTEAKVV